MKIDANDPRWTAYALGELENENDKMEMDAAFNQSAEARSLVEEIRGAAQLLTAELQNEPALSLTAEQRGQIESRIDREHRWINLPRSWMLAGLAAAVTLLLAVLAGGQLIMRAIRTSQVSPSVKTAVVGTTQQPVPKPATATPAPDSKEFQPGPGKTNSLVAQGKPSIRSVPETQGEQAAGRNLQVHPETATNRATPAQVGPAVIQKVPALGAAQPVIGTSQPDMQAQLPQSAALTGSVVDPSGAVIPGAQITVRNDATGAEFKAVTAENGTFLVPKLNAGTYTASIDMPGFKPTNMRGLQLQAGLASNIRMQMQAGGASEMVTVTAGAEIIQSSSAAISTTLGARPIPPPVDQPPTLTYGRAGGVGTAVAAGTGPAAGSIPPSGVSKVITVDGIGVAGAKAMATGDGFFSYIRPRQDSIEQIGPNTEAYAFIRDNPFQDVAQKPLSTFSIDVDTASYANMRRFLNLGQLPPKDAVRIEELLNYFNYNYAGPNDGRPFATNFEVTEAPWKPEHRLLRIGLKARDLRGNRPPSNLVFLLDVSGSMGDANKLPLVKESMRLLLDQLTENDRVAIVVYATESSLVLPSTSGDQKQRIRSAIEALQAGGSTNGAAGIQLAYQTAQENFIRKGINRVILATDGDFNVGITNRGDLTRLIEDKRKSGIFLSALGFGMGNLKDSTLELLADKGNGNYAYIDTLNEARKVLVEQLNSTLVTIAKDVKIQIEFNPAEVNAYRLIGYEDRRLSSADFNNDQKDAGEVGAGHAVTVLYELVPADQAAGTPGVDPLKYQRPAAAPTTAARSGELLTMKIRYKEPDQDESNLLEYVARDTGRSFASASQDFRFAAAVASFGMWLRDSPYQGRTTIEDIAQWARSAQGYDPYGYRQEFIQLISHAASIRK